MRRIDSHALIAEWLLRAEEELVLAVMEQLERGPSMSRAEQIDGLKRQAAACWVVLSSGVKFLSYQDARDAVAFQRLASYAKQGPVLVTLGNGSN